MKLLCIKVQSIIIAARVFGYFRLTSLVCFVLHAYIVYHNDLPNATYEQ